MAAESHARADRFKRADEVLDSGGMTRGKRATPVALVVRDTFTMPADDHALLAQLIERAMAHKVRTTKSALVRAGLRALAGMSNAALTAVLTDVEPLKQGRRPVG